MILPVFQIPVLYHDLKGLSIKKQPKIINNIRETRDYPSFFLWEDFFSEASG